MIPIILRINRNKIKAIKMRKMTTIRVNSHKIITTMSNDNKSIRINKINIEIIMIANIR
jgi:hypothetical protein